MPTDLADFAARTPVRGTSVPLHAEGSAPRASEERLSADEAVLTNVLRILNRARARSPLTPVERAFLLGAAEIFGELKQLCDSLLNETPSAQSKTAPPRAAAAGPSDTGGSAAEPAPEEAPATRQRRRPTTGGGNEK